MAATRTETGAWPVDSEPWSRSRVCPPDRWVYTTDGTLASIRLEREPAPVTGGFASWGFSLDATALAQSERLAQELIDPRQHLGRVHDERVAAPHDKRVAGLLRERLVHGHDAVTRG